MRHTALTLLILFCSSASAVAQDALIYNRSDLYIESRREKLPWLNQKKATDENAASDEEKKEKPKKPEMETVRYKFAVEMRPYDSTRLDWFQTLGGIKPAHGVLLILKPTTKPPIDWSKLLTKVDLLYIRDNGVIDTILPAISGAEMTEEPTAHQPITALLYLKEGTVDAYRLRPGNKVIHQLFSPSPRVLQ